MKCCRRWKNERRKKKAWFDLVKQNSILILEGGRGAGKITGILLSAGMRPLTTRNDRQQQKKNNIILFFSLSLSLSSFSSSPFSPFSPLFPILFFFFFVLKNLYGKYTRKSSIMAGKTDMSYEIDDSGCDTRLCSHKIALVQIRQLINNMSQKLSSLFHFPRPPPTLRSHFLSFLYFFFFYFFFRVSRVLGKRI